MTLAPQSFDEAGLRRVEVEQPDRRSPRAEPVFDVRRHREERAGPRAVPLAALEELDLALEHVERVGVVGVGVRIDTLEVGGEGELERLDVRQLGENAAVVLGDSLSLTPPG